MGRSCRKMVILNDEIGYYHVHNRCVRGAFLIGNRRDGAASCDPRKDWIQAYLRDLYRGFAVEVCDFSIMDNHIHLILRNRPDWVLHYSPEEMVRRWWHLRPVFQNKHGLEVEPDPLQLRMWLGNAAQMELIRERLSDISHFMQLFSQYVAWRANREDNQRGRFFGQRFKAARPLLRQKNV